MENHGCELIIAGGDDAFLLLKKEFPSIVILRLFGYKIRYSRSENWLILKLILQLPKLAISVFKENRWLKKIAKTYKPDVVISDNRLGMYNRGLFSIYITHQLIIKTGNFFLDRIASLIHNHFIKKYNQCWVPDFKKNGLAGELSHPKKLPSNVVYVGALSRFEKIPVVEKMYDLLISISGPEPQRTIFEKMILGQLRSFKGKALVVRGLPSEKQELKISNAFTEVVNHLSAIDLNTAFLQSKMIICRSGYTSIMDLVKIKKQAILVPTPGQTEQEYLASYLMRKKTFFSVKQKDFLLKEALLKAAAFPFITRNDNMDNYKKIISEFVFSVKSGNFESQYS
ncbi:MAG TPA: glycosyltransferase [Chitinophagaceae bacterium]|nr:glycosyltransferase [Chitinophagaceae bacterium]